MFRKVHLVERCVVAARQRSRCAALTISRLAVCSTRRWSCWSASLDARLGLQQSAVFAGGGVKGGKVLRNRRHRLRLVQADPVMRGDTAR